MWYLIEDFLEQSWIMKGFIGLAWLAIWVMIFSAADPIVTALLEG